MHATRVRSKDTARSFLCGGVYLWESRQDAERFYAGPWLDGIRSRYGVEPKITYFETLVICDVTKEDLYVAPAGATH